MFTWRALWEEGGGGGGGGWFAAVAAVSAVVMVVVKVFDSGDGDGSLCGGVCTHCRSSFVLH